MLDTPALAALSAAAPLVPHRIQRRDLGPNDVLLEVDWCGICHSDVHQVRNDWRGSSYPMVPGHEVVGRVTQVGSAVTRHRPGQRVGVGCMVNSCRTCEACREGLEAYCLKHISWTYNSTEPDQQTRTFGGYSRAMVVDEHFVLRVPESLPAEAAAPLLCAGITTYSPLRHWRAGPGRRVAVQGLGGLGHVAVKLAAAMGAEVTVLSSSEKKRADATRLGAADFVATSDGAALEARSQRLHLVLDTVSAPHSYEPALKLLARDGTLVLLGAPEKGLEQPLPSGLLIDRRRSVAGSLIGGIAETQAMLDFCAQHRVVADVEVIKASQVNQAYERMLKSDVRYRFVIDARTLA